MRKKFRNWMQRLYPTQLQQAIETITYKFESNKPEDREMIMDMLSKLNEKLEFERFLSYNEPDEEGYKVKFNFKNEKYEEELQRLVHNIHLNNGTYDRVLKRISAYHQYLHNRTRTAETLKRLAEHEKDKTSQENYLIQVA